MRFKEELNNFPLTSVRMMIPKTAKKARTKIKLIPARSREAHVLCFLVRAPDLLFFCPLEEVILVRDVFLLVCCSSFVFRCTITVCVDTIGHYILHGGDSLMNWLRDGPRLSEGH